MYSLFLLIKNGTCKAFVSEFYKFVDVIDVNNKKSVLSLLKKYNRAKINIFIVPKDASKYEIVPDVDDKKDISTKIIEDSSFHDYEIINLSLNDEVSILGIKLDSFSKTMIDFIKFDCKREIAIYEYYGSFAKSFLATLKNNLIENQKILFLIIKNLNSFGIALVSNKNVCKVEGFECPSEAEFYDNLSNVIKENTKQNDNLRICIFSDKKIFDKIEGYEFSKPVEKFFPQDICMKLYKISDHIVEGSFYAEAQETIAFNCAAINTNDYFFVKKDEIDLFFNRTIRGVCSKFFTIFFIFLLISLGVIFFKSSGISKKADKLLLEQAIKREEFNTISEEIEAINFIMKDYEKMKEKFDELSEDFYCNPIEAAFKIKKNISDSRFAIESFRWEKIDCSNDKISLAIKIKNESDPIKIYFLFDEFRKRFYKKEGKKIELLNASHNEEKEFVLEISL